MMMKMMLGGKLVKGIDDIAQKIADAFNNAPVPPVADTNLYA